MAWLIFRSDTGEDASHRVAADCPEAVIGRHKTCAIRTREHTVSRRHAKVSWMDGEYQLVDMGSSNGTFYNGQRVGEYWLQDGDEFACGAFAIRFELEDEERAPEPVAAEVFDDEAGIEFGEPEDSAPAQFDIGASPQADGWDAFDLPAEPRSAAVDIPPTQLPFEPPRFDDDVAVAEAADYAADDAVVEALPEPVVAEPVVAEPVVANPVNVAPAPPEAPAAVLPEPDSQFMEFNRQLERKDGQLAELRERCSDQEETIDLLRTQVDALQNTLDEHNRQGVSTEEVAALSTQNQALTEENERLADEVSQLTGRLEAFQSQVLRIQESQPSERELEELRAAKAERDRLWEDRERLESKLLAFKRQLGADVEILDEDADAGDLVREVRDTLTRTTEELEAAREQLRAADERAEAAEDRAAALDNRLEEADDRVAALENRVEELSARPTSDDVEGLNERLTSLESERDDLRAELDQRPTLAELQEKDQTLASEAARVTQLESDLAEARTAQSELEARVAELTGERDELHLIAHDRSEVSGLEGTVERLRGEIALHIEERDAARSALSSLEEAHASSRDELTTLRRENDELKEILGTLPDPDTARASEEKRLSAERDVRRLEAELASATTRAAELETARAESENTARTQVAQLTEARDALDTRVAELSARVEELDELLVHSPSKAQLDDMRERLDDLTRERDALSSKVEREAERARKAEASLADTQSLATTAGSELDDVRKEADKVRASAKATERALAAAKKSLDEKDGELERVQDELKSLRAQITELSAAAETAARIPELEAALARAQQDADSAAGERQTAEARVATLEKDLAAATAQGAANASLEEQVDDLTEERDDLLAANKAHVKRISGLLKQVEQLSASAKADDSAAKQVAALEQSIAELETRLTEANTALAALRRERDELKSAAEAAPDADELEQAKARLRRMTRERDELETKLAEAQNTPAAPSPTDGAAAPDGGLFQAIEEVLEDINGRVSDFRTNSETVQFCLEDVRDGRDVADNFAAATDMLNTSGEQVDAIKQAIRRFKREHLEKT